MTINAMILPFASRSLVRVGSAEVGSHRSILAHLRVLGHALSYPRTHARYQLRALQQIDNLIPFCKPMARRHTARCVPCSFKRNPQNEAQDTEAASPNPDCGLPGDGTSPQHEV